MPNCSANRSELYMVCITLRYLTKHTNVSDKEDNIGNP